MAVSISGPGEESEQPSKRSRKRGKAGGGGRVRRRAEGPDAARLGGSTGPNMAESVTRHVHVTEPPKDWRYLVCGFDTLDLGFYVDWGRIYLELIKTLDVKKYEAQGINESLWRDFKLGPCLVHAGGKAPNYRFHLQLPDYHIYIATQQTAERMPNVYVSPSAKVLWSQGVTQVTENIKQFISELEGRVNRVQVSRVDLAADFLIPGGLTLEYLRSAIVPANRKTNHFCDGPVLQTFYVGAKGAPVQVRIYDKTAEILRDGLKMWFIPIWKTVESCNDVWRVEFQVRRQILKQFSIDSPDDLLANASALWKHLTGDWLTLRLDDDSNTSRRTPCLWWQAVADLANLFGPASDVIRQTSSDSTAPTEWYVSHMSGCLASYAARKGLSNIEDAMFALVWDIRNYWLSKNWADAYTSKRIHLGCDDEEQEGEDVPI